MSSHKGCARTEFYSFTNGQGAEVFSAKYWACIKKNEV